MKYHVRIGARTFTIDGEPVEAHFAAVPGTPLYHLLLGGDSWTVAAQPLERVGHWALGAVGERWEVEVVDDRTRQIQALTGRTTDRAGAGVIKAPMPGLVMRVEVAVGQPVAAGAGLVVVEAMKMENELRAGRAGIVMAVHVSVGQTVEKGAPLVTLEAAGGGSGQPSG